jgi:hypothetical protein
VLFAERYGAAAAEDRDWCSRLFRAAGYVLHAEPGAELVHRPNETEWRASRATAPKITPNSLWDGRQTDEMVDDVKG